MRRFTVLAGVMALAAGSLVVALGSSVGAEPQSQTFEFTGTLEPFNVPADVCEVTTEAWGARAGIVTLMTSIAISSSVSPESASPEEGGYATGVIAVEPGETLWVSVGGAGGNGTGSIDLGQSSATAEAGDGGWPDGGDGNEAHGFASGEAQAATTEVTLAIAAATGGGGGSSDVRQGGSGLNDRVLAAGGGGSGSAVSVVTVAESQQHTASGGGGGGLEGGAGQVATAMLDILTTAVSGAGGGTQSSGGAAGPPNGSPGAFGAGGGGSSATRIKGLTALGVAVGGGGGGGYYGGGGGGAQVTSPPSDITAQASSGGGGSGFGPSGTVFETGVRADNGEVNISWQVDPGCAAPTPAAAPAPAPAAAPVETVIRFTG